MPIEDGYDAGRYYYYLGVTSREASNNDVIQTNHPVTFTVEKAAFTITPEDKERTKIYDGNPLAIQALSSVKEGTTAYYRSRIGTDKYTDWSTAVAEMVDACELFIQAKAVNPNYHVRYVNTH